ncbi:hypothetical protein [Rhodococcus sp. NPDC058481]|uniref:hypothetical protein n=1 Tax=unclassified Rhodococcus (in: high G+C Gram-positive bacteria) TaxID=192944 RepID=UPI00364D0A64
MDPLDGEQIEGIDLMIADETRRILTEWLAVGAEATVEDAQQLIDREALRLQQLTEDASPAFETQAIEEWQQRNPGERPNYDSTMVAKATAWRAAREMVLTEELYTQVTPEIAARRAEFDQWAQNEIEQSWETARQAHDPDRWKTLNVRPRPVATRIVERVWLEKPGWFRSLAQALVAQRIEDNQQVPMTAFDPVADELEAMIAAEMQANPPADPNMPF